MPHETESAAIRTLLTDRGRLFASAELKPAPPRELAGLYDAWFANRIAESLETPVPFAVVAVGGYGRGELCPFSDLDVLIVHDDQVAEDAAAPWAHALFHPLWDAGIALGHGVRSIEDCAQFAQEDVKVAASLMDARLVAGDAARFDALRTRLRPLYADKTLRAAFLDALTERVHRFEDDQALREPDLKNGPGGLRDLGFLSWIVRQGREPFDVLFPPPFFSPDEAGRLGEAQNLIWRTRFFLHELSRRKNDLLYRDLMPGIAVRMGYGEALDGPDRLLGELHRALGLVRSEIRSVFAETAARRGGAVQLAAGSTVAQGGVVSFAPDFWAGGVERSAAKSPKKTVLASLELCTRVAETGLGPSREASRALRIAARAVPAALGPRSGAVRERFLRLARLRRADLALRLTAETGLLDGFVPEFSRVRGQARFNSMHVHPVDEHTLRVVDALCGLSGVETPKPGSPAAFFGLVRDKAALVWAGLFHDLGKPDPEHERVGAELLRRRLGELGESAETVDEAAWLVEKHLFMVQTALHRDLSDESILAAFAGEVGTVDRLIALYLLTFADSRATNAEAFDARRAGQFAECFFKSKKLLESGDLSEAARAARLLGRRERARARVREGAAALPGDKGLDAELVDAFLAAAQPRYFRAVPAVQAPADVRLFAALGEAVRERDRRLGPSSDKAALVMAHAPLGKAKDSAHRLRFAVHSAANPLAPLSGVLTLHGFNIFAADCFHFKTGEHLAHFLVSAPRDPLYAAETFARVESAAKYALWGKLDVALRVREKRSAPAPRPATEVHIDDEASDFYTLITVKSVDRPGLLYDILSALAALGPVVYAVKAATLGDLAHDVFSVRDALGRKLGPDTADIAAELARRVDHPEESGGFEPTGAA